MGLHQSLVLSPLLLIIVMKALSTKISLGCPVEMFHNDDLALVSEILEPQKERLGVWK